MNIDFRALQIAKGLLSSVGLGLEHIPSMGRVPPPLQTHDETELERHIEPGRLRSLGVKFDAG
jgi:hypothetical protein